MFGEKPSLNNIKIAAPCTADWDGMIGNDRVRFCGQCSLNVYNISAMSKRDAENLIAKIEGRLCVRYYQRKDGTILTDNCPIGLRAIRARIKRTAKAFLSAVLSFFAGIGLYSYSLNSRASLQGSMVREQRSDWQMRPTTGVMVVAPAIMGDTQVEQVPNPAPKRRQKR